MFHSTSFIDFDTPLQLVLGLVAGIVLGVIAVVVSPLYALVAFGAVLYLVVAWKMPAVVVLGLVLLTSSVINPDSLVRVSIGVGRLYITDLILFSLVAIVLVRRLVERDFRLIQTRVDLPLLGFYFLAIVSTVVALVESQVSFADSLGEIRTVNNYLIFFVVVNLIRQEDGLEFLWKGIFVIAATVAIAMLLQYAAGSSVQILPGRVETLATEGTMYEGVTRIIPPGESVVLAAFVIATVLLASTRFHFKTTLLVVAWLLFGMATLLTFKRHLWLSLAAAFLIMFLVMRWRGRVKLVGIATLVLISALLIVLPLVANNATFANLSSAGWQRFASLLTSETYSGQGSTLSWRGFEYPYALAQSISHPLIGLGLGARYRPYLPGIDWALFDGRRYVHNGHLYLAVKIGILGYGLLMLACACWLIASLKNWKYLPSPEHKAYVLGSALTGIVVLLGSIASPMLMAGNWTLVLGILMATGELLNRRVANAR